MILVEVRFVPEPAVVSLPSSPSLPVRVPPDIPRQTQIYLAHVSQGLSMRALSRSLGVHPSTIHRNVRRIEERRDDPLFDEALASIDRMIAPEGAQESAKEYAQMSPCKSLRITDDEERLEREARRILRRLSESKAFLAVAPDAPLAVVFRETVPGRPRQTATVEREIARGFALRDWIACKRQGKVACYEITAAGRAALERMLSRDAIARREAQGFAEARTPFLMQHQLEGRRAVMTEDGDGPVEIRVNLAESPLAWLARRNGPKGEPFLGPRELEAGERLREDFERAAMGPNMAQNWQRFLTAGTTGGRGGAEPGEGARKARERLSAALKALGPGLADIAFRCCCFLEGLEAAEKRLGWSKRSGKVVLKIALQRLADHYGLPGGRD
ncbi:MAG: helix-turn-helix domain-containing protein [Alphaproteobacteria bacterium]|nr:MAG: helix-turn-helix domain-containing protein [Alphaproteobacteria bacterium]